MASKGLLESLGQMAENYDGTIFKRVHVCQEISYMFKFLLCCDLQWIYCQSGFNLSQTKL